MQYIQDNWGVIATILFGISELLALSPLKSNGIFQLIFSWLKTQKK